MNGQEFILRSEDSLLISPGEAYKLARVTDSCFVMSVAMSTPSSEDEVAV